MKVTVILLNDPGCSDAVMVWSVLNGWHEGPEFLAEVMAQYVGDAVKAAEEEELHPDEVRAIVDMVMDAVGNGEVWFTFVQTTIAERGE